MPSAQKYTQPCAFTCLENRGSYVLLLITDCWTDRLPILCNWMFNFPTGRPQAWKNECYTSKRTTVNTETQRFKKLSLKETYYDPFPQIKVVARCLKEKCLSYASVKIPNLLVPVVTQIQNIRSFSDNRWPAQKKHMDFTLGCLWITDYFVNSRILKLSLQKVLLPWYVPFKY